MIVVAYIDILFTILFALESMIKIIAKGFFKNRLGPVVPYIKNSWNCLDFFVVVASLIDLTLFLAGIDMTEF